MAARLQDPELLASAHHALFVHGMSLALPVCGSIALVGTVLAAAFLPGRSADGGPKAPGGAPSAREVATTTADHGQSLA